MSQNTKRKSMFRSDRWLVIPGVILAVILAMVVRNRKHEPKVNMPNSEPTISVYMTDTGEVKQMPLETYLEGVVAAEMDPNWPSQALEAQAIVARTFTLRKIRRERTHPAPTPVRIKGVSSVQRVTGQRQG